MTPLGHLMEFLDSIGLLDGVLVHHWVTWWRFRTPLVTWWSFSVPCHCCLWLAQLGIFKLI